MQNLFGPGAPWATPWMPMVLPAVEQIVARAPERTILSRFIPPRSPDEAIGALKVYYQKWACVTREQLRPDLLDIVPALQKYAHPPAS
jgi:hypothetical protein